jgi:hypothetical protein
VPTISTSNNKTSFCKGSSLVLTASGGHTGDHYQWMNGNSVIDGANGSTYTATAGGSYTVRITRGGCSSFSAPKQITIHSLPTPIIHHDGSVLRVNSYADHHQWYLDGHQIDGATSESHVPTRAGTYRMMTTNRHGCSVMSVPYHAMAVDIPTLDGDFMIFPNPNDGHFRIKKPSDVEIKELQVIRVHDGNTMYTEKTNKTEVNLPGLASGYYIIIIKTEPKSGYAPSRAKKFIVRK